MTEKQIQLLGFEREDFSDYDGDHYYYSYSIANGFGFISCSNDQVIDGECCMNIECQQQPTYSDGM